MRPVGKKYYYTATVLFFLIISPGATPLNALGIGGYGYGSFGVKPAYYNYIYQDSNVEKSHGAFLAGGGLVIDTNCARDSIFNYRFSLGAGRSFIVNNALKPEKNTTKISLINTFGFGAVRTESFRLWLGPQVGIHSLAGEFKRKSREFLMVTTTGFSTYVDLNPFTLIDNKFSFSYLGVSTGFSIGMNINFAEPFTLSIEAGGRFYIYYGMESHRGFVNFFSLPMVIYGNSWNWWPSCDGSISISVLYRINDSFATKNPAAEVK